MIHSNGISRVKARNAIFFLKKSGAKAATPMTLKYKANAITGQCFLAEAFVANSVHNVRRGDDCGDVVTSNLPRLFTWI